MNEFTFLSLENIDDILIFSRVCKKGNEIYRKWKNEWYTLHTQIVEDTDELAYKRKIKIIGNRTYVMTWYTGGFQRYLGEYKDGKKEGKWIAWHFPGSITQYEGEYKDDKKEGKWIFRYEDGDKNEEGEYKDGKKEGKWIGWHRGSYRGGHRGSYRGSYRGGHKAYEEEYKDGERC